jgi:3-oxoacyl-[acyl-carrier protein] reductase
VIDPSGKAAIVSGGSRGIRRAVGTRLATQGADVVFSYRGYDDAARETREAVTALGRQAIAHRGDVTDPAAANALVAVTLEAFGRVDILVNSAGITRDDLMMRLSDQAWHDAIETNLTGAFYATRAVLRSMLKARRGRIINIGAWRVRRATSGRPTTRPPRSA